MQRVFIDTNVILEGIMRRPLAELSEKLMVAIAENRVMGYISVGSFYTITFYAERRLKELYPDKSERLEHLCVVLSNLLDLLIVVGQGNRDLLSGVENLDFDDLEDSYQYQACLDSGCDCLVTINTRDFRKVKDGDIEILTPAEFIEKFRV